MFSMPVAGNAQTANTNVNVSARVQGQCQFLSSDHAMGFGSVNVGVGVGNDLVEPVVVVDVGALAVVAPGGWFGHDRQLDDEPCAVGSVKTIFHPHTTVVEADVFVHEREAQPGAAVSAPVASLAAA